MSTLALKKQVLDKISRADEQLLKRIQATIDDYEDNTIIAHTVSGRPLNIKEYREEVENAFNEAEEGKYVSSEQLKSRIEGWKKSFGQRSSI